MSVRDIIAERKPPEVSRSGSLKFAQYVRAVQHPGALLDDLERGVVEPEVLETWQAIYPEELEDLRSMLTDEISRQATAGGDFSQRQIRLFDEILGTRDAAYSAMLQNNYRKAEAAKVGPPGGKGIGEQLPTRFDRAVQRY